MHRLPILLFVLFTALAPWALAAEPKQPSWGKIVPVEASPGLYRAEIAEPASQGRLSLETPFPHLVRCYREDAQGVTPIDFEFNADATSLHLLAPPLKQPDASGAIFLETAEQTGQTSDGRILFSAREAQVEGQTAKLEEHPGSYRIGFWSNAADFVTWKFNFTRWGKYRAYLTYSTASPDGSEIELAIGEAKMSGRLGSTGSWYRYRTLDLGSLYLETSGEKTLAVRCVKLVGPAVMNLKAVVLIPDCEGQPPVQAEDGTVTLHSRDATVRGANLRYEPNPKKNTLGFWTRPTDRAEWRFTLNKPGVFDVEVWQGCGAGQGGSEVQLTVDEQPLTFVVEETGHFQNFKARTIGRVELKTAGPHRVIVAPNKIAKAAALDLRQVRLIPAAAEGPKPPAPQSKEAGQLPAGVLEYLAVTQKSVRPVEETVAALIRQGDLDAAEAACRKLIEEVPFAPSGYYNLACVAALQGQRDAALAHLAEAIDRGFGSVAHLQEDPDLTTLRDDPRFAQLLKQAAAAPAPFPPKPPTPQVITDQTAWVQSENTVVVAGDRLLRVAFEYAVQEPDKIPITALGGPAGDLLRSWQQAGKAAGHRGDLYDNRDGDHSDMNRRQFPQLTFVEYADVAKASQLHWGLQDRLHLDGVVIGNASVARTQGPFWRSMPRLAMENQASVDILHRQYRENKLYFYPCHVDHSPGRDGKLNGADARHGDVYPANTPYLVASQGSSGSDQAFLQAVAATLAAFRPETKQALAARGLLMPAVQMILRRSNKGIDTDEHYLAGAAHPPVFQGGKLDPLRMVELAQAMAADHLPPLAQMKVIEEDRPRAGQDFFDTHADERLFDTPAAIARVWRGSALTRRMVLDAAESFDAHGKALTFHWRVLQGDPSKIAIEPLAADRSKVAITFRYQPRHAVGYDANLESNRVDVGLFVHNGAYYSPPALLTWYSLDHEERAYDEQGRIQSIIYTGADEPGHYTDPLVALPKSWQDEYRYDAAGQLTGWIRKRGEMREEFTPEGRLVLERNDAGQPTKTAAVRYVARLRGSGQSPVLMQQVVANP